MASNIHSRWGHLIIDSSRCLKRCLRQFKDAVLNVPYTLVHLATQMCSKRSTWKVLGLSATRKLGEIFWVIAICVLSEILIWCLSLALRLIDIQFLSAIVGMVMVFVFMLALSRFCDSTERFYMTRIKSKVSHDLDSYLHKRVY